MTPEPTTTAPTWEQLTAIEPRLLDVERQAQYSRPSTPFYDLQAQFVSLVGNWAEMPELRASEAYRITYDRILAVHERAVSRAIAAARRKPPTLQEIVSRLIDSKAADELGRDACLLLCFVAAKSPALFFDSDLVASLDLDSKEQLWHLQGVLVAAGWLSVNQRSPRSAFEYTITIPNAEGDGQ